jgi:integration host factor subunit beta
MTKSELVRRVGELSPDLHHREVERVVNTIFEQIGVVLVRGARVEIRGFGAFAVKYRDARTGRNPRTGATVDVLRKVIPFFKTGKQLHASLNGES